MFNPNCTGNHKPVKAEFEAPSDECIQWNKLHQSHAHWVAQKTYITGRECKGHILCKSYNIFYIPCCSTGKLEKKKGYVTIQS